MKSSEPGKYMGGSTISEQLGTLCRIMDTEAGEYQALLVLLNTGLILYWDQVVSGWSDAALYEILFLLDAGALLIWEYASGSGVRGAPLCVSPAQALLGHSAPIAVSFSPLEFVSVAYAPFPCLPRVCLPRRL